VVFSSASSPSRLAPQFVRSPGASEPRARLFCFPYAGGSAPVFAGWGERLKPEIEVFAAMPKGRGMRFKEIPCETVADMVDDYLEVLREKVLETPGLPFAFYGHSLGGIVAFEVARRLEDEGLPGPDHLFIGATAPPHLGLIHSRIRHLPDNEFVTAVQDRYAGIPAAVLNEPELMELLLPVLKADFSAYENYEYGVATFVECPLTAFAGDRDKGLRPGLLDGWYKHTTGGFDVHTVAGEHFFLTVQETREFVLAAIQKTLLAIAKQDSEDNVEELTAPDMASSTPA
jgi:surfactin synthase thioesterase subunit